MEERLRAIALVESLAAADPKNQSWQRLLLWWRLKVAELLRANGDLPAATRLADEMREKFEKLMAAEPNDHRLIDRLAFVCRLQAELRAEQGHDGAADAAARAVELTERLLGERQTSAYVSERAFARLTAGRIAHRDGATDAAQQHWRRALALLEPRLNGSQHWRIVLPAAHACALLGQTEISRTLVERLQRLGFQPLEPWPETRAAPTLP
jgi:hypothetical protein